MNHKQKVKMAKKMLTSEERREGIGIFSSKAWMLRKSSRNMEPQPEEIKIEPNVKAEDIAEDIIVKHIVNKMNPKSIFLSKTFWVGALETLGGILTMIAGELQTGTTLTVAGVLTILLRVITRTPIKL